MKLVKITVISCRKLALLSSLCCWQLLLRVTCIYLLQYVYINISRLVNKQQRKISQWKKIGLGGLLPEDLGGGVQRTSGKPYPISDRNM